LASDGSELERRLLRSAQLDRRAPGAARARIDATLVAAQGARAARQRQFWLAGAACAFAAALALLASGVRRTAQPTVSAEPRALHVAAPVSPPPLPAELPPCPNLVSALGDAPMIDDLEDRNARLLVQDGRFGTWQSGGDGTGKETPPAGQNAFPVLIPGGRAGSRFALHTFGGQHTASGANLTARLAPGHCYDASKY